MPAASQASVGKFKDGCGVLVGGGGPGVKVGVAVAGGHVAGGIVFVGSGVEIGMFGVGVNGGVGVGVSATARVLVGDGGIGVIVGGRGVNVGVFVATGTVPVDVGVWVGI